MKDVFLSAEMKAGKTLRIIEARSPHLQRHCHYVGNKIHEMAVAYDRAKSAFSNTNENWEDISSMLT